MLHVSLCAGEVLRLQLARTVLGRSLHDVSSYLSDGVLIDAGPPCAADELLRWLRREGLVPAAVLNTHHHEDHVGGDALLARELGVRVLAAVDTAGLIARRRRIPFYRRLVWGAPDPCPAVRAVGERFEAGGRTWRAIATPGHAFDHVCLLDEERGWLFSGDLFVHERVRYLRRIEDVRQHLASLRRIVELAPVRIYCAHAGPLSDGVAAFERKIAWWEEVAGEAQRRREAGETPRRIARALLGREGWMTFLSAGDFSKTNLVRALLGIAPDERLRDLEAGGRGSILGGSSSDRVLVSSAGGPGARPGVPSAPGRPR